MRNLTLICALFVACLTLHKPASATWTCADGATGCTVTTARNCSVAGTSCVITVGSTTAGSIEVVCEQSAQTTVTVTVTGDGTWVTPVGSHGTDTAGGSVECAYNLNATGAATSITCTFSSSASSQCEFLRFTKTGSSITFDTSALIDDTVACTACAGAALTLGTANNYILIQSSSCGGTCSAINQSYTGGFFGGDGYAYKMNVSSAGVTPSWTMVSSTMAGGAIAIYEVVAGGAAVISVDKRRKLQELGVI